jgi:hypothetical protein
MCNASVYEVGQGLREFGTATLAASREGGELQNLQAWDFHRGCSGISSHTLEAAAPTSSSAAYAEGSAAEEGHELLVLPLVSADGSS